MISVIVSTRDRPAHLDRCLAGLAVQEGAGEYEAIVADDGSGAETLGVVEAWKKTGTFSLRHAWEENRGFRLARTRNRGIAASRGRYLVFIDGDCVPLPGFLRAHREARRDGSFLAGMRFHLHREATEGLPPGSTGGGVLLRRVPRRERLRLLERAVRDRLYVLLRRKDRPKPLGANLAVWRSDLDAVNGFDERFAGWGLEDEDLSRRLVRLERRKRFAPLAAAVIHLWHPPDPTFPGRASASPNAGRYRRGLFLARCRAGLTPRPLSDVRARVLGLPRLALAFPRGPERGEAAELEVRGPPLRPSTVDRRLLPAEVRIGVGSPGSRTAEFPAAGGIIEVEGDIHSEAATRKVLETLEDWL